MKKMWPLLLVAAVAVAGGIYFFTRDNEPEQPAETTSTQSQSPNPATPEQTSDNSGDAQHLAGANSGATLDASDQTSVTVSMADFRFDPQVLTVKVGTTVTWTNNGDNGHDVVPASNSPKQFQGSQLLATGQSYSFTFTEPGKYYYICTPHSTEMRAIVEVIE